MISKVGVSLISFRRSGTHFLHETLKLNFNLNYFNPTINHPAYSICTAKIVRLNSYPIYIYRDVRDVMKSLFNFFRLSRWYEWYNMDVDLSRMSFSDFLRGKVDTTNISCPHLRDLLLNPVKAWVDHTSWLNPLSMRGVEGPMFSVKYEDLLLSLDKEVQRISEYLRKELKVACPIPCEKQVAKIYSDDVIDYTYEDMNFLLDIAGDKLIELGYKV